MSRRSHTTLIIQVRIPVPAGKTQAATLEWIRERLMKTWQDNGEPVLAPFISPQIQVKITGRETTYL